jgi:hypothetical protein
VAQVTEFYRAVNPANAPRAAEFVDKYGTGIWDALRRKYGAAAVDRFEAAMNAPLTASLPAPAPAAAACSDVDNAPQPSRNATVTSVPAPSPAPNDVAQAPVQPSRAAVTRVRAPAAAPRTEEAANFRLYITRAPVGLVFDANGMVLSVQPGSEADIVGLAPGYTIISSGGHNLQPLCLQEKLSVLRSQMPHVSASNPLYLEFRLMPQPSINTRLAGSHAVSNPFPSPSSSIFSPPTFQLPNARSPLTNSIESRHAAPPAPLPVAAGVSLVPIAEGGQELLTGAVNAGSTAPSTNAKSPSHALGSLLRLSVTTVPLGVSFDADGIVTSVKSESEAARAGLVPGYVIVSSAGKNMQLLCLQEKLSILRTQLAEVSQSNPVTIEFRLRRVEPGAVHASP